MDRGGGQAQGAPESFGLKNYGRDAIDVLKLHVFMFVTFCPLDLKRSRIVFSTLENPIIDPHFASCVTLKFNNWPFGNPPNRWFATQMTMRSTILAQRRSECGLLQARILRYAPYSHNVDAWNRGAGS